MSSSVQSRYANVHPNGLSRAFWLPPTGHGNGVVAQAWIPILDLDGVAAADDLLTEFARRRVAAYAAAVRGSHHGIFRIWVGSNSYGTAVDLLVQIMPGFLTRHGSAVIR